MRRLFVPLIPVAAMVATPSIAQVPPPRATTDVLQKLDRILDAFAPTLGSYPPNVRSEKELHAAEKRWRTSAATVARLQQAFPKDPQVLWRAGGFYRMGHNLDESGAWVKSEKCCKAAISLDPKCAQAHLTLGTLYVNTDPSRAPAAEKEFQTVLELGEARTLPAAHWGLVFANYYQGKFREAGAAADEYLKLRPDDAQIKGLKAIIDAQVKKSGQ